LITRLAALLSPHPKKNHPAAPGLSRRRVVITKARFSGLKKITPNLRSHIDMKTSKIFVVVLLALALTLGLAASSWARPFGGGMGGGMHCANLTPDQAGKLFDLKEKFRNDTAEVRKQMVVKRAELSALWKAENPDQKAIVAKQKELNTLRGKMIEKNVAFRLEARKIAPQLAQARGMGWGMGRGRGMGPGAGAGICPVGGPCVAPGPAAPAK
jgi:zinc resistance-associated protein